MEQVSKPATEILELDNDIACSYKRTLSAKVVHVYLQDAELSQWQKIVLASSVTSSISK